jgi:hypothetical protein
MACEYRPFRPTHCPTDVGFRSYGYAAARAYVAYKDRVFLQYAVESWWFGRTYTLSQADIDAGKIGVKNFSVPALCQGGALEISIR